MSVSILKPCPEHGPRGCVVCDECGHDPLPYPMIFSDAQWFRWHCDESPHRAAAGDAYRAAFESVEEAMGMNGAGLSIVERAACAIERIGQGKT